MPTHPGRPASAKPGKSSGGWPRATPPARRPRGEIQSAGYARRHHLWRDRGRGFNSHRLHCREPRSGGAFCVVLSPLICPTSPPRVGPSALACVIGEDRPDRNVHAMTVSHAGSPTPEEPKSSTAASRPSRTRRLPAATSPWTQTGSRSHVVAIASPHARRTASRGRLAPRHRGRDRERKLRAEHGQPALLLVDLAGVPVAAGQPDGELGAEPKRAIVPAVELDARDGQVRPVRELAIDQPPREGRVDPGWVLVDAHRGASG
jgi:hypothetical protein